MEIFLLRIEERTEHIAELRAREENADANRGFVDGLVDKLRTKPLKS